jgi:flap endonuclease-1
MGIQGLMKLLHEEAPDSIKEHDGFQPLTGRKIAIDASMAMYQFLVAVRSSSGTGGQNMQLTNEAGEVTSHVQGMFNRTIRMMEGGIKPCYVFDGKPPNMKSGELAKRLAKRAKAESDLAAAKEAGDTEEMNKYSSRLTKVTKQHNDDCKILLRLMGVPVVDAPCEAEAQCAELAKGGVVWATGTEDMDALTFRTPILIRKLTYSQSSKDKTQPIIEIDVEKVLIGMKLTYEQFVDLCIMCGCDYCTTIKGIGPKNALKLIREYKNIEDIIKFLEKGKKYEIPSDWKEQRVSKKALELAEKLATDEREKRAARDAEIAAANAATNVANAAARQASLGENGENGDASASAFTFQSPTGESSSNDSTTKTTAVKENSPVKASAAATASSSSSTTTSENNMNIDNANDGDGDDDNDGLDLQDTPEKEIEEIDMDLNVDVDGTAAASDITSASADADAKVAAAVEEDDIIDEDDLEIIPPQFQQARVLFVQADVTPHAQCDVKWADPDIEGLTKYLTEKMGFSDVRVKNGIARLQKAQQKKSQQRMDSFFTMLPSSGPSAGAKRKAEEAASKAKGSKAAKGKGKFAGKKR